MPADPMFHPLPRLAAGLLVLGTLLAPVVHAADEFGTDWDDPRTADPAVARPDTKSCSVQIVDHGFDNFDPYLSSIAPPPGCPGPWNKIVLEMDGAVKGVQYDRISHLEIGGVTVFRTSTPEPSREGIQWHVEKDITAYAPLLKTPQPTAMYLGNVVNDTYTGVIYVKARVVFYQADRKHPAAQTADAVQPLSAPRRDGADLIGDYVLPVDAERWQAEVYATGSGGGCEEFWYFIAPTSTGYSCPGPGPYREVQVLIDGRVAGIAMPYPHIYTGGWSNPFLWYVIPAPRAFNIEPIRYELTPFIGLVNDGKPHEIRFRIAGLDPSASGWEMQPNLQVWRDPRGRRTQGGLLTYKLGDMQNAPVFSTLPDGRSQVATRGGHQLEVKGWLRGSRGYRLVSVKRTVGNTNTHTWDEGEYHDGVVGDWNDTSVVTTTLPGRLPEVSTDAQSFGFDGMISFEPVAGQSYYRITTRLKIHDKANALALGGASLLPRWLIKDNSFDGEAGWNYGVPRDQRHAIGHSTQRHRHSSNALPCYDRTISQQNGFVSTDSNSCR